MKKIFSIILMLLYIIPAVGVNVKFHYCGGELSSVSHRLLETKSCLCNPNKMKKGCCEDKQQSFKLDDNQQKANVITPNLYIPLYIASTTTAIYPVPAIFKSVERTDYVIYNPPEYYKRDIYLQNCVFRI
jgi:hypothetical protein